MTEYLKEEKKIDDEIAQRRSIEDFLMKFFFPKLRKEIQDVIQEHIDRGESVTWAFEVAGVDINMCIRK